MNKAQTKRVFMPQWIMRQIRANQDVVNARFKRDEEDGSRSQH